MDFSDLPANEYQAAADSDPFQRVKQTAAFRNGAHARWAAATLAIAGAGTLGGRVAVEAVRSGVGRVCIWDFDRGQVENQGNQLARPGLLKVESIVADCDRVRPGVAVGFPCDIRHAGIRQWHECAVMLDCTDAPGLAWALTETSNGTGTPLLRAAVDGSGQLELGRVLCSSSATGHACQLCSYNLEDLQPPFRRQPCREELREQRPTLAGGPIASATSGLALLQAQRLVTGNDDDLVLDREILIDLSHFQLLAIQLRRCDRCLSGHQQWQTIDIDRAAGETTLGHLFQVAAGSLPATAVTLAVYQHPLNTQAFCSCGCVQIAVGTDWALPPACPRCERPMTWLREMQLDRLDHHTAAELGVLDTPLDRLGVPEDGAMCLARIPGHSLRRFLLRGRQTAAPPEAPTKPHFTAT